MNKYNEIMEHIELTEEMRERIIGNIGARQKRRRIGRAVTWVSAAAACVVIAAGAVTLLNRPKLPHTPVDGTTVTSQTAADPSSENGAGDTGGVLTVTQPPVETPSTDTRGSSGDLAEGGWFDAEEYKDAAELSEAFGMELRDYTDLPFKVTESSYIIIGGNIAEISHFGADGESFCIRAGKTEEDVSGDYNIYDTTKETEASGIKVTLKGNGGLFNFASWIKDGHFRSVWLNEDTKEQDIMKIVTALV